MRVFSAKRQIPSQILGGLLLLALMLRALIPAGFMPTQDADGKVAVVICTGTGSTTIMMDAHTVPRPASDDAPAHDDAAKQSCPYALVLAFALPASAAMPAAIYGDAPRAAATTSLLRTALEKAWFAQGPPARA